VGFIDDGQQLGEMVPENLVEEALVAVEALAEQSVDGAAILIEVQRITAADIVLPRTCRSSSWTPVHVRATRRSTTTRPAGHASTPAGTCPVT